MILLTVWCCRCRPAPCSGPPHDKLFPQTEDGETAYYHPGTKCLSKTHPVLDKFESFINQQRDFAENHDPVIAKMSVDQLAAKLGVVLDGVMNRYNKGLPPVTPEICESVALYFCVPTEKEFGLALQIRMALEVGGEVLGWLLQMRMARWALWGGRNSDLGRTGRRGRGRRGRGRRGRGGLRRTPRSWRVESLGCRGRRGRGGFDFRPAVMKIGGGLGVLGRGEVWRVSVCVLRQRARLAGKDVNCLRPDIGGKCHQRRRIGGKSHSGEKSHSYRPRSTPVSSRALSTRSTLPLTSAMIGDNRPGVIPGLLVALLAEADGASPYIPAGENSPSPASPPPITSPPPAPLSVRHVGQFPQRRTLQYFFLIFSPQAYVDTQYDLTVVTKDLVDPMVFLKNMRKEIITRCVLLKEEPVLMCQECEERSAKLKCEQCKVGEQPPSPPRPVGATSSLMAPTGRGGEGPTGGGGGRGGGGGG